MSAQSGKAPSAALSMNSNDIKPAADANPKFLPSSQPLRHFVTNCGEKREIRETN
jgi:hypothetical protein